MFYKCRLNDDKPGEIALLVHTKFKGTCRTCIKQGHKKADCQVKKGTSNKLTTNKGVKCYNSSKHTGHIAKGCREPKKEQNNDSKKETGMFVSCMFDYENKINNEQNKKNMKINKNEQNKNTDVEDNKKKKWFQRNL